MKVKCKLNFVNLIKARAATLAVAIAAMVSIQAGGVTPKFRPGTPPTPPAAAVGRHTTHRPVSGRMFPACFFGPAVYDQFQLMDSVAPIAVPPHTLWPPV